MELGFNKKELKVSKDLVINHDFTNAIIFGRTGSGKTSCAILPNIEDRIKNDFGVLVYDFKGNLHAQVKYIANKYNKLNKVTEIGKPWGAKINLFDYLNLNYLSHIVPNNMKDPYWDNAARSLFETVAKIHKELHCLRKEYVGLIYEEFPMLEIELINVEFENNISFKQIHNYVNNAKSIKDFYNSALNVVRTLEKCNYKVKSSKKSKDFKPYENTYENRLNDLKDLIRTLEYYNITKNQNDSGRIAVLNHLSSILTDVSKKDYLNESEIDLTTLLRKGEIVIIDVSRLNKNSLNILNLAIYTKLQKTKYNEIKPVTIFIDEAQKVLNENYLPEVDVCRESKFEYIFATQDEILLENKLGKNKFDELYVNIISKYSFATNINELKYKFEYIDLSTMKKAIGNPIFFNEDELLIVEHKYQKEKNILIYSDYKPKKNEKYILVYDEILIEDYKILIKTLDKKYLESRFISHPNIKYLEELKFEAKYDYHSCTDEQLVAAIRIQGSN